jgi:hypothetical protein
MTRANENANAQDSRDLNLTFMAFKRAEASSPGCPPDKNAIPGTAAGTARVDVMWHLIKDAAFRDNPPNPAWTRDDPEIDRLLQT